MTSRKNIAIIISSTREPRVGPSIAELVHRSLVDCSTSTNFKVIDLREYNLPLLDDLMASRVTSSDNYLHEHTRRWSREIIQFDGYVFVTAQYNWSVPASLKNALDFLYHEWNTKPALIVSYGNRGGNKAAAALVEICKGLRMVPYPETIQLPFNLKQGFMDKAEQGILIDDVEEVWKEQITQLKTLWPSFEQKLNGNSADGVQKA